MHSGSIIKKAMEDKRISQGHLSRLSGVDQALISKYIRGLMELSDKAVESLLKALEMDPVDVMSELIQDRYRRKLRKRRWTDSNR